MRAALLCAGVTLVAVAPPAHAAWGPAVPLADDARADHRAPVIVRNAAGDAVAAWARAPVGAPPGVARVVIAVRRGAGPAWTRARAISGPGTGAPAVALGPRGAAVVAWGIRGRVYAVTRASRRAPWRAGVVADGPGRVTDVTAAADASGAMAVMWSEAIGARHRVRRATRAPRRASWSLGAVAVVAAGRPALAVGAGGRGVVAWTVDGRVAVTRLGRAGFSRPVAAGEGNSAVPSLARAGGGHLVVGWRTRLPGGSMVVGAAAARGGTVRSLGDIGVGDHPRVAVDARGDAVVAWPFADGDGENAGVQALVLRRGGTWRPLTVVRRGPCGCRYSVADVAVDRDGGPVVAWRRDSRDGRDVAAVVRRRPGDAGWAGIALRPVPDAGRLGLSADGAAGTAVIWSAGAAVRAMMGRGGS